MIRYTPGVVQDRDLVVSAGQILALALDRRRLYLDLITANDALQNSRARLIAVADDALGGRLWVDSRAGQGTDLIAELPCES